MSAMKPSAIRAKVVTLAGRRTNNFGSWGTRSSCSGTVPGTRAISRGPSKQRGLNLRQAYYLCEIAERLRPFTRHKERFEAIGWTKTRVIARGLNKQNLKERLALAEAKGNFTRKLQSVMKGETPWSDARRVVLYFTKNQYGEFEKAVLQNGGSTAQRGNLVDKELALMAVIERAALRK